MMAKLQIFPTIKSSKVQIIENTPRYFQFKYYFKYGSEFAPPPATEENIITFLERMCNVTFLPGGAYKAANSAESITLTHKVGKLKEKDRRKRTAGYHPNYTNVNSQSPYWSLQYGFSICYNFHTTVYRVINKPCVIF